MILAQRRHVLGLGTVNRAGTDEEHPSHASTAGKLQNAAGAIDELVNPGQ